MRGDRKTEARIHAARIPLDRGIDEILNAGELDDFVELLPDEATGMPMMEPRRNTFSRPVRS